MNYLKGLAIAATLDLAWLMGSPRPTAPDPRPPLEVEVAWTQVAWTEREDSLMTVLNARPEDVAVMQGLATMDMENGWYEQAIGPLARALQIAPERRSLWVALDRAVEGAGWAKITDLELTRRALEFRERVEIWGHGC